MLQDINLDTERFEDIVEEARKKISVLYPEWTDYNYHDPGITMIELFAWLKEIQQYYLNQVSVQNKELFFSLLGIKKRHNQGAIARIDLSSEVTLRISPKSRFYAGDTVFESIDDKTVISGDICAMIAHNEEEFKTIHRERAGFGENLRFYPFGEKIKKGNSFYIMFDTPLPCKRETDIFFRFFSITSIIRNPIGNFPFYPLGELSYDYYTKSGFQPLTLKMDDTCGMLQDGSIFFELEEEMAITEVGGEEGYFIRITVHKQEYDIPPLLSDISVNTLLVKQTETIFDYDEEVEENKRKKSIKLWDSSFPAGNKTIHIEIQDWDNTLLGYGRGFSNQRFPLEISEISYEDFELMVGHGQDFVLWHKKDNFYHSGPSDCHYQLLMKEGEQSEGSSSGYSKKESYTLFFGDGVFGQCPHGEIRILSLKRTKGSGGNVKSGAISKAAPEFGNLQVRNMEPAFGGRNNEPPEEAMRHFCEELTRSRRLVTAEDYEKAVKETPGLMIHSCKVIRQGRLPNLVEIVVKPCTEDEKAVLGAAYRENISRYLEDKRMIGTEVQLLSPEYVEVELFGDICLKPQYVNARKDVELGIQSYFQERRGIFGKPIVHSRLLTLLEKIQAVSEVKSLNITTRNEKVIRNYHGDLVLPANAIALLKSLQFLYRL